MYFFVHLNHTYLAYHRYPLITGTVLKREKWAMKMMCFCKNHESGFMKA